MPVPPGAPDGGQVITTKGYNGPVLVSSDGRTLTVGGGGLSRPCFGTLNPVAIAERTVVALWLRYVTPSQHGVCRSDMALYPPTNVRLSTPVGGRVLVNGATGHPLSWFSLRELLRPSAIPAGLRPGPVIPGAPVDGAASMASGFTRSYQSASYSLDIVESSVPLRLPEVSRAPGPIEVRGLPGQGTVGDQVASGIMWHEAGIYIEILAEYSAASGSPLSVPQLITIADSAPPLPPVRQG